MSRIADPEPVAQIVPEGQTELLAGLHQAKQIVPSDAPVAAHSTAGDLVRDHKTAQIIFGRVGVKRDFRPLEYAQQFCLSAQEPQQQLVEIAITGADREDPVKSGLKSLGSGPID